MSWADLFLAAEAVRTTTSEREPDVASMPIVGIGWATVEGERAIRELDVRLGPEAGAAGGAVWLPAARDALLGASAWTRTLPGQSASTLVVLEPDTEGRLAASLARHGEGVLAVYLQAPRLGDAVRGAKPGPLGSGRLVAGGPSWGPHAIVLGGTPR